KSALRRISEKPKQQPNPRRTTRYALLPRFPQLLLKVRQEPFLPRSLNRTRPPSAHQVDRVIGRHPLADKITRQQRPRTPVTATAVRRHGQPVIAAFLYKLHKSFSLG